MKKKEIVYREMLSEAMERKQLTFTQLALSRKFGFSLSTISNALRPLERIGAIEKKTRAFSIVDTKKALIYWASIRNLRKDVVYSTRSGMPVMKIEGSMPPGAVFSSFSAYRMKYDDVPADYGEVYVYAGKAALEEIRGRFPSAKGPPNIIVLKKDPFMPDAPLAPAPQIFVDLWNVSEWYAKDFLDAFTRRLFP